MTRTTSARAFVLVCFGFGLGCSGNKQGVTEPIPEGVVALSELADLLRSANSSGRPPAKLADLAQFDQMYPRAYQAVKSGDVVVIWGTAMKGEGESGGGGVVIAHEKAAPTSGGHVLFTSGEVKRMTAAEFQAAPKAK